MIKNYFIIAFRNIRRNFSYAFLNVFGLTLGIASCLVIFLIVRNELTYDNFAKADRTYRVTLNAIDFNSNVSLAVAPAMRTDFPELTVSQVMYSQEVMVKVNNNRFREKGFALPMNISPAFSITTGLPATLKPPLPSRIPSC